jgi:ABC-type multidrug transport system ATPase subunit
MIVGLVRPNAGSASVDGVALVGDGTAVRRRCTYSPGEIALFGEMRARDQLRWFLRGRQRGTWKRAREIAGQLGLPLAVRVHTYSHGMKRQLMFAASMAVEVPVRILDEASEGLDPNKRSAVLDLLQEDAARGTTILLSSHHLAEVDRACERFAFLSEGRLISVEDASAIRDRAARVVSLTYAAGVDGLERAFASVPGVEARVHDRRVVVELSERDPRPLLRALAERGDLPPPETIEYGQVSLQQLYRDLYGVEAC